MVCSLNLVWPQLRGNQLLFASTFLWENADQKDTSCCRFWSSTAHTLQETLIRPASLSNQSTGVDAGRLALAAGTAQEPRGKWPRHQDGARRLGCCFVSPSGSLPAEKLNIYWYSPFLAHEHSLWADPAVPSTASLDRWRKTCHFLLLLPPKA